jgi:MinD-like ATPase involved in chromosome partitioning or flagellar assembly
VISEPEIALVFSPEPWFGELHRHLSDHGGARVRQVVMDPALALQERFAVLVVSGRWPALTQLFVERIHALGRCILGVYDPLEPAGAEHLDALGVDGVVPNDVPVAALLVELQAVAARAVDARGEGDDSVADANEAATDVGSATALVVVGGTPGAGRSEVALSLAHGLSARGVPVLLVDADDIAPSLGQRLGAPIEPNLRSAIDAVQHGIGSPAACVRRIAPHLDLLCGVPNAALWAQVRATEVLDVLRTVDADYGSVVADVGSSLEELDGGTRSRFGTARTVVGAADALVGVGTATPVGVSRLLGWVAAARALNGDAPIHLAVNRVLRSSFRESEMQQEIRRTFEPATLTFLPLDLKVERAVWTGSLVEHGPFVRTVRRSLIRAVAA